MKEHITRVRGIDNLESFLDPPSSVVHSPLLLKNIRQAMERVMQAISEDENISVFADPDVDGLCSTYIMVDYLKKHNAKVKVFWNERSQGHGINEGVDKTPANTDLLLLIDSSTSDVDVCKKLSKDMDIVIIDHHNPENENPYALIVNPQLQDYPNKSSSATLLTFKFVELMDCYYKKVNMDNYLDVVGMSLLGDQMDMTVPENRYFVKRGFERVRNVGLLALLDVSRNKNKKLNSQIFHFDLIPMLNTVARNDELRKGFSILFEKDYFKAKEMAKVLYQDNKARKERVKELVIEYMEIIQDEKFAYVVTENSTKSYNGLCASKIGSSLMKPCFVLRDNSDKYQGSYRSYNNFPLQSFLKKCPYTEMAAGHEPAGGFSIKAENWNKFKQYVNDNIDDSLFNPVIEYDIELAEDELTWESVDEILEFDTIWGNGNSKITVRLNDVFVEDKELFPPTRQEHVKIKAGNIDLMKFGDPEYASDISEWDSISCVGSISVNEFKGDRRIQFFIEDYLKN